MDLSGGLSVQTEQFLNKCLYYDVFMEHLWKKSPVSAFVTDRVVFTAWVFKT